MSAGFEFQPVLNSARTLCDVAFLLINLAIAPRIFADATAHGSVEGAVSDPSGGVVRDVAVRIRHLDTAAVLTTTTNGEGLFWFPVVPVGAYELIAEKRGFATLIQRNLVVTVGSRINLAVSLALAATDQSTTFSADPPLLESTRSQVSTTIDSNAMSACL